MSYEKSTMQIAPSIGSKGIGIISAASHIDHIAPLCQLLGLPLLLTDPHLQATLAYFYPPMEIFTFCPEDGCLDPFLKEYDLFLYTEPCRSASGLFRFYDYYTTCPARSIFTHHGNSEKSFDYYWFERLVDEDILLVYGKQMADAFQNIGFTKPMISSGNYRLLHYLQNAPFWEKKLQMCRREKGRKNVLYAPTWSAKEYMIGWQEEYSPFFSLYERVFEGIKEGYHLFVKLHPNYFCRMLEEVQELKKRYQDHPDITFIDEIPNIYPILSQMDIYVGDFSSIGYDFLYFDRPMFFVSDERRKEIFRCGVSVTEEGLWKEITKEQTHLSSLRKELYQYAFGDQVCASIS